MITRQPLRLPVTSAAPAHSLPRTRRGAPILFILRQHCGPNLADAARRSQELLPEPPPQAA
jgi:hypothetical protein